MDINDYEARFELLTVNVDGLSEFTKDIDAEVTVLERRVKEINIVAKSKGKKFADVPKKK